MRQNLALGLVGRQLWGCGLLFLLSVSAISGCDAWQRRLAASLSRPSTEVRRVHLSKLSLRGVTLTFEFQVSNPYRVALPIGAVAYDLASGSDTFLSGEALLNRAIPAGGSESFSVPTTVNFAELMRVINRVKPGTVLPYEAGLRLSADAPGLGPIHLPMTTTGELPVPSVPAVELSRVQWTDLSYTKAQAVLNFSITNTNQFPITVSQLTYGLSLASTPVAQAGLSQEISLNPSQSQGIVIPISVAPAKLGLAFFKMISGDGAGYKVAGTLEMNSPFGPMNLPYQKAGRTPFSR